LLTLATYFPDALFVRNVLVGGDPEQYPPDNFFPATWGQVGFMDLTGGDYRLSGGSPYKGAGTDGEDLGADIEALLVATAGVADRPRLRFFRAGNRLGPRTATRSAVAWRTTTSERSRGAELLAERQAYARRDGVVLLERDSSDDLEVRHRARRSLPRRSG
jgi:hypothetical protein